MRKKLHHESAIQRALITRVVQLCPAIEIIFVANGQGKVSSSEVSLSSPAAVSFCNYV